MPITESFCTENFHHHGLRWNGPVGMLQLVRAPFLKLMLHKVAAVTVSTDIFGAYTRGRFCFTIGTAPTGMRFFTSPIAEAMLAAACFDKLDCVGEIEGTVLAVQTSWSCTYCCNCLLWTNSFAEGRSFSLVVAFVA